MPKRNLRLDRTFEILIPLGIAPVVVINNSENCCTD